MIIVATVTNSGSGAASNAWSDVIYIATNAASLNYAGTTVAFTVSANPAIPSGGTYTWTNVVTLPSWTSGNYVAVLAVDGYSSLLETIETNNTRVVALTMTSIAPVIVRQPQGVIVDEGDPYRFDVLVAGTLPMAYQWFYRCFPMPWATSVAYAVSYAYRGDAGDYHVVVTNFMGSATSSNAILVVNRGVTLGEALDETNLAWLTSGDGLWSGKRTNSHDGVDVGGSGIIGHNQLCSLRTDVIGPGILSFWWRTSSQSGGDYLRLYLDGVDQGGRLSGETVWSQRVLDVPSGDHSIVWTYSKNGSTTSGQDRAWVDQVVWTPTSVAESVSTPSVPSGPSIASSGQQVLFLTGGATNNRGHAVQYLFEWGDGGNSGWIPVGAAYGARIWSSSNTYQIRAMARCADHTNVVSAWSGSKVLTITNPPPTGSLTVQIQPPTAVTAGAQWTVDGGSAQQSGALLSQLPIGVHTVSFSTVSGWLKPLPMGVVISNASVTQALGYYILISANVAPVVTVTNPLWNAGIPTPTSVAIWVQSTDANAGDALTQVVFFAGAQAIYTNRTTPLEGYNWFTSITGTVTLSARVWDRLGAMGMATGVPVRLGVAAADADGDTVADWMESIAGTDARNPLDLLWTAAQWTNAPGSGSLIRVTWPSVSNRWYGVERSTDLLTNAWLAIASRIRATPPVNVHTDATATARINAYRIIVSRGGAARLDFDGDGKSDYGCYDPASGNWYFMQSSAGFKTASLGGGGTLPIAGDFDGDGRTDYGSYLPASGAWTLRLSSGSTQLNTFGFSGTLPVTGDFDGDGKDDYGCYYPAGGNWYFMQSSAGFKTNTFGYAGTLPVTGDFDGDGKEDYGCYYPAGGNWYFMQSSAGFKTNTFGYAGTLPVTGDFDGDGKDDYGCYFPAGGNWYFMQSSAGFKTNTFGYAGTLPVTGDFDGDSKDDYGCYYPTGGNWYLMQSTVGFKTNAFGYAGTLPIQ